VRGRAAGVPAVLREGCTQQRTGGQCACSMQCACSAPAPLPLQVPTARAASAPTPSSAAQRTVLVERGGKVVVLVDHVGVAGLALLHIAAVSGVVRLCGTRGGLLLCGGGRAVRRQCEARATRKGGQGDPLFVRVAAKCAADQTPSRAIVHYLCCMPLLLAPQWCRQRFKAPISWSELLCLCPSPASHPPHSC